MYDVTRDILSAEVRLIDGYSEPELLTNRASLFLHGGTAAERRAWAEEVAEQFGAEGPLREVTRPEELLHALGATRGVVFIPDALALGARGQTELMRCLLREERPKLVLGLPVSPEQAEASGLLRTDLGYRLRHAAVDLGAGGLREAIRARRAKAKPKPKPAPEPRSKNPRRRAAR